MTIPGGTFWMGGDHSGSYQTNVSSFQMGRTPVTNEQYARYLASLGDRRYALIGTNPATRTLGVIALGPSEDKVRSAVHLAVVKAADGLMTSVLDVLGYMIKPVLDSFNVINIRDQETKEGFDGARQPVVNVNWFEAAVYAFLHGGMLPTEWQWEYAAAVVQGKEGLEAERNFATPSRTLTHEEAHYDAETTVDVDDPRYPTLENGLRHMTGNVNEWMRNGPGVDGNVERMLRGGGWRHNPRGLRAVEYLMAHPSNQMDNIGFRVVAPAEPTIR